MVGNHNNVKTGNVLLITHKKEDDKEREASDLARKWQNRMSQGIWYRKIYTTGYMYKPRQTSEDLYIQGQISLKQPIFVLTQSPGEY